MVAGILAVLCGCNRPPPESTAAETPATHSAVLVAPVCTVIETVASGTLDLEVSGDDWFEDVTDRTGIEFAHRNGRDGNRFFLIESFGGGAAAVDYDQDGDTDLLFTGGGEITSAPSPVAVRGLPPALYRNQGHWRFTATDVVTRGASPPDYPFGTTAVDYDGDGFTDLFLYCAGCCRLYQNMGDGGFREVESLSASCPPGMWTAAVWGDVDHDGLPDLFLARYADWTPESDVHCFTRQGERGLCGPSKYAATSASFLRNRGDGGFEDRSATVGLQDGVKALGLLAGDFDADGRIDFYLANDETANHLYWGSEAGQLIEDGWPAGVAAGESGLEEGSMGVDAGDVDGDGRLDLWVVNYESEDNSLYCGVHERQFEHATVRMGLAGVSRMRVGWGTTLTDFDGDGWLDILVLNGHALYAGYESPWRQRPQLFHNTEGARFQDVSSHGGSYFRAEHAARGGAVADFDDDGASDFAAVHLNESVTILRNRRAPANYVRLRLRGLSCDRDAIGARITLTARGRPPVTRWIVRGSGYASHSDDRLLFPLNAGVDSADVVVDWPGGVRQTFLGMPAGRTCILVEGRGTPHVGR